jgi:60 kDa SS-A/Ro ribonucleoprotein
MSDFHFVGHFCKPKKTMRFLKSIDKRAPATEADLPVEAQSLRMNLNTLLRYDVFNCGIGILPVENNTSNVKLAGSVYHTQAGSLCHTMVDYVADRIADESEIRRGKQFPYQYFAAYLNADDHVPQKIAELRSLNREG